MEKLAVLSDLHANLSALSAVERDMGQRGVSRVVVLGDVVGYLTRPNRVARFVRQKQWPVICGNYDLAVVSGPDSGAEKYLKPGIGPEPRQVFQWTCLRTKPETKAYLAGLPTQFKFRFQGVDCLAVHGSPDNLRQYVYPDHDQGELNRWLEREGVGLLLMGHTHRPFTAELSRGLAVNPGSVGKPKDSDPRASYALISGREGALAAQIVRVDYDMESEARLLDAEGLPEGLGRKLFSGR